MEIEVVVLRWRDAVRISRWIAKSEAEGERLRLIHSVGRPWLAGFTEGKEPPNG